MTVNHISCLPEFCLRNTYFTFQGRFYEQKEGAAMGSPISPIVANLFTEDLEVKVINTSPWPPSLWKRYVNDTFTIIKTTHRSSFLEHINSIDPNIQFSSEDSRRDVFHALLGYSHYTKGRWQAQLISIQKAYPQ